jgi:hypothetical protein
MSKSQVFCSGCNLVVAPNAPGAYLSASPGVGRVHGRVCESKGIRAQNRRREALNSLNSSFNQLRDGMSALLGRVRLSKRETGNVPQEFTGTPAGYAKLNAEAFATLLGQALSVLYAACQNGKSHLRPEIMAFADLAGKTLGCRVHVRAAEDQQGVNVLPTGNSRIERFQKRFAGKVGAPKRAEDFDRQRQPMGIAAAAAAGAAAGKRAAARLTARFSVDTPSNSSKSSATSKSAKRSKR